MNSYYAMNDNIREENNCTFFSTANIFDRISTNSKDYADYFGVKTLWSGLSGDKRVMVRVLSAFKGGMTMLVFEKEVSHREEEDPITCDDWCNDGWDDRWTNSSS